MFLRMSSLHTFFLMSLFLILLSQVQCLPLPPSTAFKVSTQYLISPSLCCFEVTVSVSFFLILLYKQMLVLFHYSVDWLGSFLLLLKELYY